MTVNDIGNDFVDSSDEVNDDTPDIKNDDQKDSDDEYPNNGTPISNEDIENELLIALFNTGIFVRIIWLTKLKKMLHEFSYNIFLNLNII